MERKNDKKFPYSLLRKVTKEKTVAILGIICIVVAIILPICISYIFNLQDAAHSGDMLTGLTAPFIGFLGTYLVFYSLWKQVEAKKLDNFLSLFRVVEKGLENSNSNLFNLRKDLNRRKMSLRKVFSFALENWNEESDMEEDSLYFAKRLTGVFGEYNISIYSFIDAS